MDDFSCIRCLNSGLHFQIYKVNELNTIRHKSKTYTVCEGQCQSSQRICAHLLNCRLRRRSYKLLHTRINTACTCYSSRIHLQSPESLHVALVTALTYTTEESILIDLQSCKIPPPPPAIRSPRSKRSHLSTKGAYGFGYRLLCVARCCLSL